MTYKLLIVEDDLELQELYIQMLEGSGWEIEQVYDGPQALARLQTAVPDVLILDILLDDLDGDELYRQMRREPRLAGVPVVVVSVLSAERCRLLMQVDELTQFLRKPFHRQALLEAIERARTQGGS